MIIETREEASLRGAHRYFTGTPCSHGHLCFRYVRSNRCTECHLSRVYDHDAGKMVRKKKKKKPGVRYESKKPCKYGHVGDRYVKSNRCVACSTPAARAVIKAHNFNPAIGIETLEEARARGGVRYNDGKPCKYGHRALRYARSGACVTCESKEGREERKAINRILDRAIESKAKAAARGEIKYYTARPCANGHDNYRYVKSGACIECVAAYKTSPPASDRDIIFSEADALHIAYIYETEARVEDLIRELSRLETSYRLGEDQVKLADIIAIKKQIDELRKSLNEI